MSFFSPPKPQAPPPPPTSAESQAEADAAAEKKRKKIKTEQVKTILTGGQGLAGEQPTKTILGG